LRSIEELVAEIAKCDVLCENCHAKAHAHERRRPRAQRKRKRNMKAE
jgi:hypothetical protein